MLFLGPLSPQDLMRVIVEPARAAGILFENGLVERIIADVGSDAARLPLLQMLLYTLASETAASGSAGSTRFITQSDYAYYGTDRGALDRRLENIWHSAEESDRPKIRSLFLQLVTANGMRRTIALDNLPDDGRRLANQLIAHHVVIVRQDVENGRAAIEVADEAIFRSWRRYATWLTEEREFLAARSRISDAAGIWSAAGHDPAYLLSGDPLARAGELLMTRARDLPEPEKNYVEQSIKSRERASAWTMLSRSLGLTKLEKELLDRAQRHDRIREQLTEARRAVASARGSKSRIEHAP